MASTSSFQVSLGVLSNPGIHVVVVPLICPIRLVASALIGMLAPDRRRVWLNRIVEWPYLVDFHTIPTDNHLAGKHLRLGWPTHNLNERPRGAPRVRAGTVAGFLRPRLADPHAAKRRVF